MKRFAVLAVALCLVGCQSVSPDAGQEAVLIQKPLLMGHGGVDDSAVKTGRAFVALTTDAVYVDMQPQQFVVHFDDLMSMDGVPLDFDSVIRLQVTDSVSLIKNFGPKWYDNNVKAELSNRVRQAVRKHGMNETAIDTKAIDAIDAEVSTAMEAYIKQAGVPVKVIDITVGKANPPDSIKSQRIETAAQQQRQLTEQQRKLAEDQRRAAEESRARADNGYREAMQLSPDQYLALEAIKMQREVCAKSACTFVLGDTPARVLNLR
jgi:regulator of protease activity HflC (stomatin/prohibitin superfamily)